MPIIHNGVVLTDFLNAAEPHEEPKPEEPKADPIVMQGFDISRLTNPIPVEPPKPDPIPVEPPRALQRVPVVRTPELETINKQEHKSVDHSRDISHPKNLVNQSLRHKTSRYLEDIIIKI